jgi:hypothetical protein
MGLQDKIVRMLALRWLRGKAKDLRSKDKETSMGKALKFFEGWRLLIAVAGLFLVNVWDAYHNGHTGQFISSVLVTLNWLPPGEWTGEAMSKAVLGAVALFGFSAKLWKAQKQLRAGSPLVGLLSEQGFVASAVVEAAKSPVKAAELEATILKANAVVEANDLKVSAAIKAEEKKM